MVREEVRPLRNKEAPWPVQKVVWTFKDFTNFGNSMPVQVVLDEKK